MKTILCSGGSNSSVSINWTLARIAKEEIGDHAQMLDLRDYDLPMYSMDTEKNEGIPAEVKRLHDDLRTADAWVISVAEHNGNLTAFFKNIIDWLSRLDNHWLEGIPVLLLSTSPGQKGAASSAAIAEKTLAYFKGEVLEKFSLPGFHQNVDVENLRIIEEQCDQDLKATISCFLEKVG